MKAKDWTKAKLSEILIEIAKMVDDEPEMLPFSRAIVELDRRFPVSEKEQKTP